MASTSPIPSPSKTSQNSDEETYTPVGRLGWPETLRRVDRLWVPNIAPHHSVIGQTGSGKSHLITRGILPMVQDDNVLIIDSKGGDETLAGYGRPVRAIPKMRKFKGESKPRENWFRMILTRDVDQARRQVLTALDTMWDEGNWIIVADEIKHLTDARKPNLGIGPHCDEIWLRGRSKGLCLIAGTQAPTWVPGAFYQQCSFFWVSRIKDERAQKRIMEIASLNKAHLPMVASIRKRTWLYGDDEEDETFMALTSVGAK